MRLNKRLTIAALSMGLIGVAQAAAEGTAPAHHHDHANAPASLQLNDGKKWETDAPLRLAMGNIRQSMAASLHRIHQGQLSRQGYAALAKQIDGEVASMVANCKLAPQADAQLHVIIAALLDGSRSMADPTQAALRQSGAVKVIGALEQYGTYFQDPGFSAITHSR